MSSRWDERGTGSDGPRPARRGAADERRPPTALFTEIIGPQDHFRRKSYRLSASAEMDTTRHSFGCYGHGAVRHRRGSPTRRHAHGRTRHGRRSSPGLWPHGPSAHRRDDCPTVPAIQHPAILDPLSRARLRLRVLAKHGSRSRGAPRLLDTLRYDLCSIRPYRHGLIAGRYAHCAEWGFCFLLVFGGAQRKAP